MVVLIFLWGKVFLVCMVCKVLEYLRSFGVIYYYYDLIFWEFLVFIYFSYVFRIFGDMLDGNC